jgi:beta-fructofuranosidase
MGITRGDLPARALGGTISFYLFRKQLVCKALTNPAPQEFAADPRRPQFHLLPAASWMNTPNGSIYSST